MTNYENDIMDLLEGETPREKYNCLLEIMQEPLLFAEWLRIKCELSEGSIWRIVATDKKEFNGKYYYTKELLEIFRRDKEFNVL